VVRRRRPRQRRWAGRRRGDRLRSPCSCHARNRDGRGEREEQARREGANRGAFFFGHSLPNSPEYPPPRIRHAVHREDRTPSLSVKQLEPAKSKPADVLTILRPASWQLLNF